MCSFRIFPTRFCCSADRLWCSFTSVRHSADIDLLSRTAEPPTRDDVRESLDKGLTPAAEALHCAPLQFEAIAGTGPEVKPWVRSQNGQPLFTVDLNRFGSVLESEIEEHNVGIDDKEFAKVKSASREFLLLQKAECFLLRKFVKARDAYDIHQLRSRGAALVETLKGHLSDTLSSHEIETEDIVKRIEWIDDKHCRTELQPLLPPAVFDGLAEDGCKRLRDALSDLYRDWL